MPDRNYIAKKDLEREFQKLSYSLTNQIAGLFKTQNQNLQKLEHFVQAIDNKIPGRRAAKTKFVRQYTDNDVEMDLARYLYAKLLDAGTIIPEPDWQRWCTTYDMMIRVDGIKPGDIRKKIDRAVSIEWWAKRIISPYKLMKHYNHIKDEDEI